MTLGSLGAALAVAALVVGVMALVLVGAALWAVRRLRAPLMLARGVGFPLRWRWSLSRQALLHRRLVAALTSVRLALPAGRTEGPWAELAADVEALAVDVDRQLVVVDRQPRTVRQREVGPLEDRVREVEETARRLTASLRSWEAGSRNRSGAEIIQRLEAIDGALAELTRESDPPR